MKSNYKPIGDYIKEVKIKNKEGLYSELLGINIDKFFMPSVANTVGVDLKKYKVVEKGQFACNRMHVGRDYRIPIALSQADKPFIVSPAYTVFEIIDTSVLLPEYVMMWFSRKEFDRECWFHTDADVRGGLPWALFCDVRLPIPSIEKQRKIVKEYNTIVNRIKLNETLNQKLEETAQALYKHWFVDFNFPISKESHPELVSGAPELEGKPYKSSGGAMVYNEKLDKEIPVGWKVICLCELTEKITKGTTPKRMYSKLSEGKVVYLKGQSIGQNHFVNKSKINFINVDIHEKALKRSIIIENDILFTITGAMVGDFAIADKTITPANTNQNVAIIRFNKKNEHPFYLFFLLLGNWHREFLIENTQDSIKPNLNLTMIGNMKIILPDENVMSLIMKLVKPIINKKYISHNQLNKLIEIKNLLLSKMTQVKEKEMV